MNNKFGLTCFSILFLGTLTACGGGGGGDGSAVAPPRNNGGGGATPKAWGTATLIETDNAGDANFPQIAIDAGGNALAVWHQYDGARTNIWSNRYTAGTGWGTAALIETDNADQASAPQIAIEANGNAMAVWTQSGLWFNRYTAGTGWGTAALIDTDVVSAEIAIDAGGNALAVWSQYDGTRNNIWSNRYTAGIGWGTAALIETDNAGDAVKPQLAIDPSGNAVAVWQGWDGTRYDIWSNRYTAGTGWGTAVLIETDNAGSASTPQVAIDAHGNASTVWYQFNGTRHNIWANRYTAGTGWGTAALIETDNTSDASGPQIAIDAKGNALAVWNQADGTRHNIWSNRYTAGTGWGTAALIETDNAGHALGPQIAIDGSGNALAVWAQLDRGSNIWSNRYTAGTGWGTAVLIETDNTSDASGHQIAINANGNAMAVWQQWDGTRYNIWANHFQ